MNPGFSGPENFKTSPSQGEAAEKPESETGRLEINVSFENCELKDSSDAITKRQAINKAKEKLNNYLDHITADDQENTPVEVIENALEKKKQQIEKKFKKAERDKVEGKIYYHMLHAFQNKLESLPTDTYQGPKNAQLKTSSKPAKKTLA